MSWIKGKWENVKTCDNLLARCIFDSYRGWKMDWFWEFQAQKIMGRPKRNIYIVRKTELLWQKDDVLCLWNQRGVVYYELLKPSGGTQQMGKIFTGVIFTNFPKDGKMYNKRWCFLEKNPHLVLVHWVCSPRTGDFERCLCGRTYLLFMFTVLTKMRTCASHM